MVTVQSTLGHAHIVDQIIQYLTIMLLDNASFGANTPVVSRFTHVRPMKGFSQRCPLRGTITDGNRKSAVD